MFFIFVCIVIALIKAWIIEETSEFNLSGSNLSKWDSMAGWSFLEFLRVQFQLHFYFEEILISSFRVISSLLFTFMLLWLANKNTVKLLFVNIVRVIFSPTEEILPPMFFFKFVLQWRGISVFFVFYLFLFYVLQKVWVTKVLIFNISFDFLKRFRTFITGVMKTVRVSRNTNTSSWP